MGAPLSGLVLNVRRVRTVGLFAGAGAFAPVFPSRPSLSPRKCRHDTSV